MVPFVSLASVCRSLQCLVSTLTQAGRGGLLFRFTYSVVLWGGRGAADKCHWRVWGALPVFRPHWVCPAHGCVLSPSILLRLQAALQGAGPELRALPRPKLLSSGFWVLHKDADSVGPAFCAFPIGAAQATRSLRSARSPGAGRLIPSAVPASVSMRAGRVHPVSVLGSWTLAVTLPADVDHPESQEVFS